MGVPIGEAEGEFPTLLECKRCDARFETDETMTNECPECDSHFDWEMVDGNPDAPWRDDVEE